MVTLWTRQVNRAITVGIVGFIPPFIIVWVAEYMSNVVYAGYLGGYGYILFAAAIGLGLAAAVNAAFDSRGDDRSSRSRRDRWSEDPKPEKPAVKGKAATGLFILCTGLLLLITIGGYCLVYPYYSWGASNHTAWSKLGNITEAPKGEKPVLPDTDPNEFIVTDVHLAYTRAHAVLGTGGNNLGSYYDINESDGVQEWVDGKNWITFPLQLNGWSEQEGFFTRQIDCSPGFIAVPTDDPDGKIKIVDNLCLKYMTGSYFSLNLQRYVYSHGYSEGYLMDPTMEHDDNWKPYWTIAYVKPALVIGGNQVVKVLVVDPTNGKIEEYDPDKAPDWIDRVISLDMVAEWSKHYGLWSVVPDMFNNNNAGQKKPDHIRLVNVHGQHQVWQIPLLANNDKAVSTNGLIIYETRKQAGVFYEAEGVSGMPSYTTLKGTFENLQNNTRGWHVDAIQWYQIRGVATYMAVYAKVLPNGQTVFAGVGFLKAGITNSAEVQYGESRDQALARYYDYLDGVGVQQSNADETTKSETVNGTILRIGHEDVGNGLVEYTVTLVGDSRLFILPRTVSPLLRLAHDGDKVTLNFEEPAKPRSNHRPGTGFRDVTVEEQMQKH
jgi:hypothetical protein